MATSIEMSRIIAAAAGIAPKTTLQVVRTLGEAALISRGGRGNNAPEMTTRDAARFLIAILVTERPADAPKAVRAFGALRLVAGGVPVGEGDYNVAFAPAIAATFEEAIAEIIQYLADRPAGEDDLPNISISANVSELLGTIESGGLRYAYAHSSVRALIDGEANNIAPHFALREQYANSKRRVRYEFAIDVLAAVAAHFQTVEAEHVERCA
jgi:hypothetical protein